MCTERKATNMADGEEERRESEAEGETGSNRAYVGIRHKDVMEDKLKERRGKRDKRKK